MHGVRTWGLDPLGRAMLLVVLLQRDAHLGPFLPGCRLQDYEQRCCVDSAPGLSREEHSAILLQQVWSCSVIWRCVGTWWNS